MSSHSPCASCKLLRRKCTQECVLAPYFPPDQHQKFASVHNVFGQSNVAKLLNELHASQREDAAISLAFEAEERLRDPVYGCVGLISILQNRVKQLQIDLYSARKELANYIGPDQAMLMQPQLTANPSSSTVTKHNVMPVMGPSVGQVGMHAEAHQHHHAHPQQIHEAQQLAAVVVAREQEMLRSYEQQQQQQEIVRFNGGFEPANSDATLGFNQINPAAVAMSSSLALSIVDNTFQIQPKEEPHPNQLQDQLLLQPQQPQSHQQQQKQPQHIHQHQKSESKEGWFVCPY